MKTYDNLYKEIVSLPNLYKAYLDTIKGKKRKITILKFQKDLHSNLFELHKELMNKTYEVSPYNKFYVNDYKRRKILAPKIKDSIVHHAIYNFLIQIYDPTFIETSFACRIGKGTHKAFKRLNKYLFKYNDNEYFIKMDVSKYFYSIDQYKLLEIIKRKIKDKDLIDLLEKIIFSHKEEEIPAHINNPNKKEQQKGIPIGCLLSQLFANIYLNELDQYVKNTLKIKHYIRYVDDFIILVKNKEDLNILKEKIRTFLKEELYLTLIDEKIQINKISFGVDFVGFVCFRKYIRLRTKNYLRFKKHLRKRINLFKNNELSKRKLNASFESYLGHIQHSNSNKIKNRINNIRVIVFSNNESVQRGGNWSNAANAGPFLTNLNNAPDNTNNNIGFRCCSEPLEKVISSRRFDNVRVQEQLHSTNIENRRGNLKCIIGVSPMIKNLNKMEVTI